MGPVSTRPPHPGTRPCAPTARRQRRWKAEDELCGLLVCLVMFKRLQNKKKDPVVRERVSWRIHATTLIQESAFQRYYRMSIETFQELLYILGKYLVVDYYQSVCRSRGVPPLTPAAMLQCTVSWLAGGSYHHIRVITGISTASFYRVDYKVMYAINDAEELAPQFPKTSDELKAASAAFQACSNYGVISDCVGVIDGWLCPIRVPRQAECGRVLSFFSGHYQKYGLNVQACADHLCRFTAFSVNSPGGMNDSYAFQRWKLSKLLKEIPGPYFVIGDNAYVQSRRVMTPFNKVQLDDRPKRDSYNFHVSQLRIRVEMAFGLLVNRWRILKQPLLVRLRHCRILISSCIRLHNFCITQRCRSTQSAPEPVLRSIVREVRAWNHGGTLDYDRSEVELDNGRFVDLMDEKVRSHLVACIASQNLHRPERVRSRNQARTQPQEVIAAR